MNILIVAGLLFLVGGFILKKGSLRFSGFCVLSGFACFVIYFFQSAAGV